MVYEIFYEKIKTIDFFDSFYIIRKCGIKTILK